MKKQFANIVTVCRILCSICLLFFHVFSAYFYITYLFCGITDMIDGTIARKTNTVSEFGARLDTAADIVFTAICLTKILPLIHLPIWLWVWIFFIVTIKIGNIVWGFIHSKKLISLHTFLNKSAGFSLFISPLTLNFVEPMYSYVAVCSITMLAALNEAFNIRKSKEIY